LNIKVSQGSIATYLKYDGIFNDHCVTHITAESNDEGILKISQHLPKLLARIKCPLFFDSQVDN